MDNGVKVYITVCLLTFIYAITEFVYKLWIFDHLVYFYPCVCILKTPYSKTYILNSCACVAFEKSGFIACFSKELSDHDVFGCRDLYIRIRTLDNPDFITVVLGKRRIIGGFETVPLSSLITLLED